MQANWVTGETALELLAEPVGLCTIPVVRAVRKCANKKCGKHLAHGNKDTLCFTCRRVKTRKALGLDKL